MRSVFIQQFASLYLRETHRAMDENIRIIFHSCTTLTITTKHQLNRTALKTSVIEGGIRLRKWGFHHFRKQKKLLLSFKCNNKIIVIYYSQDYTTK